MMVDLPVQPLDGNIPLPTYAHDGDAGLDLRCTIDFSLAPGERFCVPTGIAVSIPMGFAGFVIPRSGLAAKHGISIVNAPGLIDSNYRGEIKVILINLDAERTFSAHRGERIAQLVIAPVATVQCIDVDTLPDSNRGASGFGSSGTE